MNNGGGGHGALYGRTPPYHAGNYPGQQRQAQQYPPFHRPTYREAPAGFETEGNAAHAAPAPHPALHPGARTGVHNGHYYGGDSNARAPGYANGADSGPAAGSFVSGGATATYPAAHGIDPLANPLINANVVLVPKKFLSRRQKELQFWQLGASWLWRKLRVMACPSWKSQCQY